MAAILITGGTGFVGVHVAEAALARDHRVRLFDARPFTPPSFLAGAELKVRVGDVRDEAAVAAAADGMDVIIHCAAVVGPIPARSDPRRAVEVNVLGMQAVLAAAARHGIGVVHLSTATLYGRRPDLAPLDETAPVDPVSVYDATKAMAETLCEAYRKTFSIPSASLRTGFVYGLGNSTGEYYVPKTLRGESVELPTGADSPCDFTYVVDLARGLVAAAEHMPLPEAVYNVTGGRLATRGDFAAAVRRHLPDAEIRLGPGIDPAMHLRGPCVLERARRDFGYVPVFDLDAGIADWIARTRAV